MIHLLLLAFSVHDLLDSNTIQFNTIDLGNGLNDLHSEGTQCQRSPYCRLREIDAPKLNLNPIYLRIYIFAYVKSTDLLHMDNFYDFISKHPPVKRLQVNDLLLAEYQCPLKDDRFEIWSHHNYFIYVTSGEKKWFNLNQVMHLKPGDCLFVRKGAQSVYQIFNNDFCALVLFVPDAFIRSVLVDNQIITGKPEELPYRVSLFSIQSDEQLSAYFRSFYTYLTAPENPNIRLIELKFRELVLLAGTASTKALSNYFASLCKNEKPPLREIMEDNFNYPMSLEEYARLCCRSLSAFKREFKEVFGTTPGRWLTQRRLDLARYLLENTGNSVMETALDAGFNNHAHFSRVFKEKFGMPPLKMTRNRSNSELTQK